MSHISRLYPSKGRNESYYITYSYGTRIELTKRIMPRKSNESCGIIMAMHQKRIM